MLQNTYKLITLEKYVQQNSFHLPSNNSEILVVQHFRRAVPKTKNFAFLSLSLFLSLSPPHTHTHTHARTHTHTHTHTHPKKTFISETGRSLDIFKKVSMCVCNSTFVVSTHPLSPASSTFSALKTPEYTEEEPDDSELADGDIQMEYFSD